VCSLLQGAIAIELVHAYTVVCCYMIHTIICNKNDNPLPWTPGTELESMRPREILHPDGGFH